MFGCVKDHHNLLLGLPLVKNTCARQVVLDKLSPLNQRGRQTSTRNIKDACPSFVALRGFADCHTDKYDDTDDADSLIIRMMIITVINHRMMHMSMIIITVIATQ